MKDVQITPLDDAEIDQLNQLLFDYSEQVEQQHGKPGEEIDCIFSISELDGFLTALLSGPEPVSPSVWLPAIWRGQLPTFASEDELQHLTDLLIRHMNTLADNLYDHPEDFAPIYELGEEEDGEEQVIVDEWCYGYMRAVQMHEKRWQPLFEQQAELLAPMLVFSGYALDEDEQPDSADLDLLRESIVDSVFAVRDFWIRESEKPKVAKPGRNDPCSCGSGKKFKQCCLH